MPSCCISVSINGNKLRSSEEVPSEDKGRTTHESVISEEDVKADPGEVELFFEDGNGVLFLWYIEILVKPKKAKKAKGSGGSGSDSSSSSDSD